jgi:multiple sugar transport system permease protein
MHRAIFGRRTVRTSILIPYGIITVIAAFAFRFAVQPDTGFLPATSTRWAAPSALRHDHPHRGLEDDAVHEPAAAGRPGDRAGGDAGGGQGRRRHRLAAAVEGDAAEHEGAILVALLFRTLDAFRIFDTVFVQTAGANGTQTISGVGYNTLVSRVNLGLGSAVSMLLFLMIILIAFIFVKGFKTNLGAAKGER